jgi:putative holliday junction resolvase
VRILGLDIGSKRIGVAVSDPLHITAQALETVDSKDTEADIRKIKELIVANQVEEIVVGIPYNMNGSEGPQAQKVKAFVKEMSELVDIPVREWDERLTTVAAERVLLEADLSRAKRRKVIDKVAAAIILQGYLDYRQEELPVP